MQPKPLILLLLGLVLACSATAQHFTSDVEIKRERTFTGTALYGFMNGGSELFLEYDFQELKAIEVLYNNEEYTIEVYRMKSPTDAFGIYSVHTFKCHRVDSLGAYDCLSKFQLQAASGEYYISVVFPTGRATAQKGAEQLLRMCIDTPSPAKIELPEQLKNLVKPPYSGRVKYAKGPLGAFAIDPELASLIEPLKDYEVWYTGKSEKGACCLLQFAGPEECAKFSAKIPSEQVIQQGAEFIVLCGIP